MYNGCPCLTIEINISYAEHILQHPLDVDFYDIMRANASEFGLIISGDNDTLELAYPSPDEDADSIETYSGSLGEECAGNRCVCALYLLVISHIELVLSNPPGHFSESMSHTSLNNPSVSNVQLSNTKLRKIRKDTERKEKMHKEKNYRRQRNKRQLKEVRGFERGIASKTSVTQVDADFSKSPHTRPGFVGLSTKTHPLPEFPVSGSQVPVVSVEDLDPDCDETVKDLVRKGWTYIVNDIE